MYLGLMQLHRYTKRWPKVLGLSIALHTQTGVSIMMVATQQQHQCQSVLLVCKSEKWESTGYTCRTCVIIILTTLLKIRRHITPFGVFSCMFKNSTSTAHNTLGSAALSPLQCHTALKVLR